MLSALQMAYLIVWQWVTERTGTGSLDDVKKETQFPQQNYLLELWL